MYEAPTVLFEKFVPTIAVLQTIDVVPSGTKLQFCTVVTVVAESGQHILGISSHGLLPTSLPTPIPALFFTRHKPLSFSSIVGLPSAARRRRERHTAFGELDGNVPSQSALSRSRKTVHFVRAKGTKNRLQGRNSDKALHGYF